MALSDKARKALEIALASSEAQPDSVSKEIADAIESGSNPQAAAVAALGVLAAVGAVDVNDAGPADVALSADVDARVASLQAKIDAVIAALKAAGLMAS